MDQTTDDCHACAASSSIFVSEVDCWWSLEKAMAIPQQKWTVSKASYNSYGYGNGS